VIDRIASRFAHHEPPRHAGELMLGLAHRHRQPYQNAQVTVYLTYAASRVDTL
jgi:hypothetical protein